MSRLIPSLLLFPLAAASLSAQGAGNADVMAAKSQWQSNANYILQSAKDMPEEKYSFKPTPEVRSFGELVGHVAGAQNMICATAMGEKPPAENAVEQSAKSKADLIAALQASNDYCAKAYGMTDAAAQAPAEIFGMKMTRFGVLVLNTAHTAEHYGNVVTYLRINGIVPPSSRRQGM